MAANKTIRVYRTTVAGILKLGKFRWIVSDEGDPGFRVFGVEVYYYKWSDTPLVYKCDEASPRYRLACKQEIALDANVWCLCGSPAADRVPIGE